MISEETRAKLSAAGKGRPHTQEHKDRIRAAHLGKRLSPEHCARLSEVQKGKKLSESHRLHVVEALKRRRGDQCSSWKGGVSIDKDGRTSILSRDHPHARQGKYVYRSRLTMEAHLGRYLLPEEVVHHGDMDKGNDSIENLYLFANDAEHTAFHHKMRREQK